MNGRVEALAEAARKRALKRVAERLAEVPGVRVTIEDDHVLVTGRGLWRLRWIGGVLR